MKLRGKEFGYVFNCSGARGFFGNGYWFHRFLKIFSGFTPNRLTFVAKTLTLLENRGNAPVDKNFRLKWPFPRCIIIKWFKGVALNAVGLSGRGVKETLAAGILQKLPGPVVLSFMANGKTKQDRLRQFREFVALLEKELPNFEAYLVGLLALQVNISCPNAKINMKELEEEALEMLQIAARLGIPIDLKVNVFVSVEFIKKIEASGLCDVITCSNTIPWLEFDNEIPWEELFGSRIISPLIKRGFTAGGLSGIWLLPYVADWFYRMRQAGITMQMKAGGGILTRPDILLLKKAGANAIELGSGNFFFLPWGMKKNIIYANKIFGEN